VSAYIISGLVLGSIYAIAATGLVLTYKSSRIFNFGHGAIAFLIARMYYQMAQVWHWNSWVSAALSILVFAPLFGVFLWGFLFRHLTNSSQVVRLVATIGLFVAIPAVAQLIFGYDATLNTVGLAGANPALYHVFGVTLNLDQVLVLGFAVAVAVGMFAVMRFTTFGLLIRAVVDSATVSRLVGTDPQRVSMGTWALGAMLAGLAGVLLVPLVTLDVDSFNILVVASFAAVVLARMDNLLLAFVGGLVVGLAQQIVTKFIPSDSVVLKGIVPSMPFILLVIFLLFWGSARETVGSRAQAMGVNPEAEHDDVAAGARRRQRSRVRSLMPLAVWAVLLGGAFPLLLSNFWLGLASEGLVIGTIFLSFTVITGQAGIISLGQSTLAGVGAIAVGQFATEFHWPMLLAVLLAGATAATLGVMVALISVRLGDLYVALTTLGMGLLLENMIYTVGRFDNFSIGVAVTPPKLGPIDFSGKIAFYLLALFVFSACALVVWNLKRSSTGLELAAVRSDAVRATTLGIRPWRLKVSAFAIAAFIAGVGGSMLAMYQFRALPSNYATITGLVWFAVVATLGLRSIPAALIAGITFSIFPQIISDHLSQSWQTLPTALFGLGAIAVARHPDGVVAMHAAQFRWLRRKVVHLLHHAPPVAESVTEVPAA
jgi:branched-chain amino acid transport system permease protein